MKINLPAIMNAYYKEYYNIFNHYYPAHGSAGFTERNQAVNFANAIKNFYGNDKVIVWYEAPFGEKKDKHFDAVIFLPSLKELYIVEAKRFTNRGKLTSVKNDIDRIVDKNNIRDVSLKFKDRNEKPEEYTVFAVILADIWEETGFKKELSKCWSQWADDMPVNPHSTEKSHGKLRMEIEEFKADTVSKFKPESTVWCSLPDAKYCSPQETEGFWPDMSFADDCSDDGNHNYLRENYKLLALIGEIDFGEIDR